MEGGAPAAITLGLVERRILGVLVEKARTVPDTYPLSLNALVAGCNQKSNRDPLLDLQEIEIQDCLEVLQAGHDDAGGLADLQGLAGIYNVV